MHTFYHIFGLTLPSYGSCIALGVVLSLLMILFITKKNGDSIDYFLLMLAYTFIGALAGSKALFLITSYNEIQWDRLLDLSYLNLVLTQGFVFYGGLIGGLVMAFLSGKFHKFNSLYYIRKYIFIVPFAHAFGRLGCFMAGCCYGREWHGSCAVVFPEGSLAPAGVPLFPTQLTEAVLLFAIFLILIILSLKFRSPYTVECYLLLYGIIRFILEFFRGDEIRGHYLALSTSQWVAIAMVLCAVISIAIRRNKKTGS